MSTLPAFNPDATHLWLDLAIAIGTHPSTRTVADTLRAVHRAGHAGTAQNALSAHLTIEERTLDDFFDSGDRFLKSMLTDFPNQRSGKDQAPFNRLVGDFQRSRMTH